MLGSCFLPSSHHQCFLTRPPSCCLYLCLSLHDLNSQASSHLLVSLRLSASLARCSRVALRANVCERHTKSVYGCVYGLMKHVCCMCVFVGPSVFLSSLCPQFPGSLQPPVLVLFFPLSLSFFCLFSPHACVSLTRCILFSA